MDWEKMGSFQVDQVTSDQFAKASGDFNPLHIDPVLARRYQFGATVIHGVYGVFKALDLLLEKCNAPVALVTLKVQFAKRILHDECVDIFCQQLPKYNWKLRLIVSGKRVQEIDLTLVEAAVHAPAILKEMPNLAQASQPKDLLFDDVASLAETFDLVWDGDLMQSLFAHVKRFLPDCQSAVLLGLTHIVGMRCPGLHSVFGGFKIHFEESDQSECDSKMHFNVAKSDSRFSMITIGVSHHIAHGEITAFFRPKPVLQEEFTELQSRVMHNQFAHQKALIIGGSRGIGEVTAKLIAAGGGHAVITYYQGQDDANKIVHEVRAHGGKCDAIQYNVLSAEKSNVTECFPEESVTHIYYFASPLIETGDQRVWDEKVFQKFCRYYLSGFANLMEQFLTETRYGRQHMTVFMPSTIFLDQPQKGFNEYVAAKAAAEALARQLSVKLPNWEFKTPRLPRLLTDQTSGLNTEWTQKTAEIILAFLNSLNPQSK